MIPAWVNDFVGIPFVNKGRDRSGADCWGLVVLVLHDVFGISTPDMSDAYEQCDNVPDTAPFLALANDWRTVEREDAQPGDVIVITTGGQPRHIGLVVAPGWFLHSGPKSDAVISRMDAMQFTARVYGVFRHQSRVV